MGVLGLTGNQNVDTVLFQADAAASDGGCYRGISEQEFAALQRSVRGLTSEDRRVFSTMQTFNTEDPTGAYGDVIDSLQKNQTYEQYLSKQRQQPAGNVERPAACDLVS